eukprot:CCRYP_004550-RA/>CCRYP_004550-RA protein AED:0.11 eAED:0.11 QI:0/-1/0/1/-1/1/1/0/153
MIPRHFAISFSLLAFSDVAFGRIGSREPNVFAPRPIRNSSNLKAGDKGKSGRGLLHYGDFGTEIERNFKVDERGKISEMIRNKDMYWDGKDDEVHEKKQAKGVKKHAHQHHGHGKLRKLAVDEKRKAVELSKNFVVEEPINLCERLKNNGGII